MQSSLEDIKLQFKEAKELLEKEREAAKQLSEKVPEAREVPVVDQELINKLTAENEQLKVCSSMSHLVIIYYRRWLWSLYF